MLWIYIAVTAAIWCLIMFGPGKTVIHQGTYVMVLLAFTGSIFALWAVSPWLALVVASLQIELNFLLYVLFLQPAFPRRSPTQGPVQYGTLILALLSLIPVLLLLRSLARRPTAEAPT